MKKLILTTCCFAAISIAIAQDAKIFHEQGIAKNRAGKLEEAIRLFDKSIALDPYDYASWHHRGVTKGRQGFYKESLPDFDRALGRRAIEAKNCAIASCAMLNKKIL